MKQRERHSRGFSSLKFIMEIAELKCLHSVRLISLSRPILSAQMIHNRFEKSSGVRTIRLGMCLCVFTIFLCLPSSPLNTGESYQRPHVALFLNRNFCWILKCKYAAMKKINMHASSRSHTPTHKQIINALSSTLHLFLQQKL